MKPSLLIILCCIIAQCNCFAQEEGQKSKETSPFTISGFVDSYYTYTFNNPTSKNLAYFTQPARHNEFNLNWGILQANYQKGKVEANFALQEGTFVRNNYAGEPGFLRNIYLANVSYKLTNELKATIGIREAAINLESNLSIENPVYSRSFAADIMPYYQSGLALTWTPSKKFTLDVSLVNGLQKIQDNNSAKSLMLTASYQVNDQLLIGYGNYIGNDNLDSLSAQIAFFNDFYVKYDITDRLQVAATVEYHAKEQLGTSAYDTATEFFVWLRYKLSDKWSIAAFFENYNDPSEVLMNTGTPNGFMLNTGSLNLAYRPQKNMAIRLEGKFFTAPDELFPKENMRSNNDAFVTFSMALKF
ncbi:outer membrane beta-barrel protein [Microscilla marina]|uniref:Outer membrane protein, putative n=1 Tax=Microscilla marina ATCC 23134 TaxID=313606 RepID=A1ZFP2_MICM2|nr:outer membrane beta-barrel protein [Microscilla marina]EAY30816.1 outer membrane protein, putative [Microscilla marina ATCC 23134]